MRVLAFIPARLESKRFPNKIILGKQIKNVISNTGFDRFAIRFSNADIELSANSTEYKMNK